MPRTVYLKLKRVCNRVVEAANRVAVSLLVSAIGMRVVMAPDELLALWPVAAEVPSLRADAPAATASDGGAMVIYAVVILLIGSLLTVPSRRRSRRFVVLD